MSPSAKTALVLLARGFEEVEAVTAVDVLRRAHVRVVVAATESTGSGPVLVAGAHGLCMQADTSLAAWADSHADAVVIPGGSANAKTLASDKSVHALLRKASAPGGSSVVAAICAGPTVLAAAGVCKGRRATAYPGFAEDVLGAHFAMASEDVVTDACAAGGATLVTSRGPATAMAFSLALVETLCGSAVRSRVASELLAS